MKSKKIIAIAKGLWAFCSYVFVPQWGRKQSKREWDDCNVKKQRIYDE